MKLRNIGKILLIFMLITIFSVQSNCMIKSNAEESVFDSIFADLKGNQNSRSTIRIYDLEELLDFYGGSTELKVYKGNSVIEPDSDGNYLITETGCKFELKVTLTNGIESGVYEYKLPLGVRVSDDDGYYKDIYIGNSQYIERRIYDDGTIEIYFPNDITEEVTFSISEYIDFSLPSIKDEVKLNLEKGNVDVKISATIPKRYIAVPRSSDNTRIAAASYYTTNAWIIYNNHSINENYFEDCEEVEFQDLTVKLKYDNEEVTLKNVNETTENDERAYWIVTDGMIALLNRCQCSDYSNCYFYNGTECECGMHNPIAPVGTDAPIIENIPEGWCLCWNFDKNSLITIEYEFPNLEKNSDIAYDDIEYYNFARLHNTRFYFEGMDYVELNSNIIKESSLDFYVYENYITDYLTGINTTFFDFSGQEELLVEEKLENLAYVPGTIQAIAISENREFYKMLELGKDYTVEYIPGENTQNILNVKIKNPKNYAYAFYYNTQLVIQDMNNFSIETKNTSTFKTYRNLNKKIEYTYENTAQKWYINEYSLTVNKVDEADENKKIAGAKFAIFAPDGIKVAEGVTDENGQIIFETDYERKTVLTYNVEYYLQEIDAPENYYLDETKYEFYYRSPDKDIDISESSVKKFTMHGEMTITNKEVPQVELKIYKADASNKKLMLLGGKFGLYKNKECTELVEESTELGNGLYSFSTLRLNRTYYLKDIKAPDGYMLDSNTYMVTLENGLPVITTLASELYNEGDFTFYNKKVENGTASPESSQNAGTPAGTATSTTQENTKTENKKALTPDTGGKSNKGTSITIGLSIILIAVFILKTQYSKKIRRKPRIGRK